MTRIYLDHNATTPLRPEARAAMLEVMDRVGNPSAVNSEGRRARAEMERARGDVARLIGGLPEAITFTSGGSEGAATLLSPGFAGATRLIVGAAEHSCVRSGGRFLPDDVSVTPVDGESRIDLAALEERLSAPGRALVALQAVNNETGVIQPLAEVASLCRKHDAALVVDAVQAIGKIDFDYAALGAEAVFLSGHKFGAAQGTGAIWAKSPLVPLIRGGGQEGWRRAGTENLVGIVSMGAAARAVREHGKAEQARIAALRDWMEVAVATIYPDVVVLGRRAPRVSNTSSLLLSGVSAETTVIALDLSRVSLAAGSACASGKVAPSHVLAAMGLSAVDARSVLRISAGWTTTSECMKVCVSALRQHLERLSASRAKVA
jgi:cysteine desulfurase